jgi:hypothetical protein
MTPGRAHPDSVTFRSGANTLALSRWQVQHFGTGPRDRAWGSPFIGGRAKVGNVGATSRLCAHSSGRARQAQLQMCPAERPSARPMCSRLCIGRLGLVANPRLTGFDALGPRKRRFPSPGVAMAQLLIRNVATDVA